MSAESEYVWDFQVPGFEPEIRRKTTRTLDSCNLQLIPFQPHTFDSIVTLMMNREASPFTSCPHIMCACCKDYRFWLWGQTQGLEEPINWNMCPHCDAIICNRCAMCHSKFSVETMNRKCKWCKKSVFPSKNRQFSPTNSMLTGFPTGGPFCCLSTVINTPGYTFANSRITSIASLVSIP